MSNSYAEKQQITCPDTNQPFEFDVWLIIDRDERPDLIIKAQDKSLHTIISPYTNRVVDTIDVPLLLFQATNEPRLIYIYSDNANPEVEQRIVIKLLDVLKNRVGVEKIASKFPILPKHLLSEALEDIDLAEKKSRQIEENYEEILAVIQSLQDAVYVEDQQMELCEKMLHTLPEKGNEIIWAEMQNRIGTTFARNGKRTDYAEKAIQAYRNVLLFITRDEMPFEWASTIMNMGNAYDVRLKEKRTNNIEEAISLYEKALEIFRPNTYPKEWLITIMQLGNSYRKRIEGSRKENLEKAIDLYKKILIKTNCSSLEIECAQTKSNLGAAYADRVAGDRSENIEIAIDYYEKALRVISYENMPSDWIQVTIGLGNAYFLRIKGENASNITRAIDYYDSVLRVLHPSIQPQEWFTVVMHLGNLHVNARQNQDKNIEKAIQLYHDALDVLNRYDMPVEQAQITSNLGTAYSDRIEGNRKENIEKAIQLYHDALDVLNRYDMPVEQAQITSNLGTAYSDRIEGNRKENIEKAIQLYHNALTITTKKNMMTTSREIFKNLGNLYFKLGDWKKCAETYRNGIIVGNQVRVEGYTDPGLQNAIAKTSWMYIRVAFSLVKLGNFNQALQQIESGKARLLSEAVSIENSNLPFLDDTEREKLLSLRETIRSLEVEYRLLNSPIRRDERIISDALREAHAGLRRYTDELHGRYPNFMPEGLAIDTLLALIPEQTALIVPIFTTQGSAIFIIPHGTQEVTVDQIILMDDYKLEMLNELLSEWLHTYVSYRVGRQSAQKFFDIVDTATRKLWDAFIGKIHDHLISLDNIQQVLFIPQGALSLLPIHAAWYEMNDQRRYFMDDFQVSYTPSMYAFSAAKRRMVNQLGREALIAGVSQYTRMNNLPNTKAETEAIAKVFKVQALIDSQATVDAIKAQSKGKNYLHLSCHGSFGWGSSIFASSLYFTSDEPLTLSEIIGTLNLETTRLVTLSACETGLIDFQNIPDEFIGLPAGFMQAGASAIISSLWMVEDRSTALLMEHFYKLHLEKGISPSKALCETQLWLRNATRKEIGDYYKQYLRLSSDEAEKILIQLMEKYSRFDRPYSHPFYWSAFVYNGI